MLTVDFSRLPLKAGMRVLDAGCGGGRHLCESFRTAGVDVAGVDLKWDDLCKARGYLNLMAGETSGRWVVAQADVTKLPFADGSFDIVVCSEVLEHIEDNRTAVRELVRVLKPGGDLVVTVPRLWAGEDLLGAFPGLSPRAGRSHPDLPESGADGAAGSGGCSVPADPLPARPPRALLVAQVPRRTQE